MTLDERLELATKYDEVFGQEYKDVQTIIEECKQLKVLGYDWGEVQFGTYGKIHGDFILYKGGRNLSNRTTKYRFDDEEYYIHWDNGNVGRYMFLVDADYSEEETKIWEEFRSELISYNPLDYDGYNCHMIYNIEDGKRLMNDYEDICDRTREKFRKYSTKKKLEKAKEKYEKLLAEVQE